MFTGIIKSLEKIKDISANGKSVYVWFEKPAKWKMKAGDSISIDGICSTVKRLRGNLFEVEYMPETLKKTTAGIFKKGTQVNLEPSLRSNDRLNGHLVQGHVDTTGNIIEVKKNGKSVILKIGFPKEYKKFITEKGSISVNGVSLTVVAVGSNWFTPHLSKGKSAGFTVSLVSYTLRHTNLQNLKNRDRVNIEVDVLARYMHKLINK